jgi:hypothetical protein
MPVRGESKPELEQGWLAGEERGPGLALPDDRRAVLSRDGRADVIEIPALERRARAAEEVFVLAGPLAAGTSTSSCAACSLVSWSRCVLTLCGR